MAVPFRRKSSTRIKKGRGPKNWKFHQKSLARPLAKCANCKKIKIFHHICLHCSTYRIVNSKLAVK
ncbi:50S ribosomal protein L32 [endosymbiont GvMRE of Glomus versiforme]|uniref:50S ribosomal protein L32 n=1 Tax=endosymbiont GvMRE of Glomus versiforme TaxID=2039283 RepID=UPI000EEF3FF7|nr:50S ribosomal protein L32 [endosymbiont GvMRE of Glomus versiforme]